MSCGVKNDIPLYVDSSPDWHSPNNHSYKPYSVDLSAGVNEYVFGRTTPNNNFVVSTGLIKDKSGIEMIGGSKKSKIPKTTKKVKSDKSKSVLKKTTTKTSTKKVKPATKSIVKKTTTKKVKPATKSIVKKTTTKKVKPTTKSIVKKTTTKKVKLSKK
jgi:hypothetical protein